MTSVRQAVDGFAATTMIGLCSLWGLQQVIIKVAAADIPPVMQLGLRSVISAVLVALVMVRQGGNCSLADKTLGPGLLAGGLFGVEFLCISEGLRFTTASHMVVFLYTAPAFTALGLHWFLPAERLRPRQWLGIAISFGGIALAFAGGIGGPQASIRALWGDLLGVLAGVCWAATTVIIRTTTLSETAPSKTLLYQLVLGAAVMLPYGVLTGQAAQVSNTAVTWGALAFHGVVISFGSYLAWFWLLRHYLAARLAIFSFLTPLFGVGFGVWLLGDPMNARFAGGAVLVLTGVALASGAFERKLPAPAR